jgi:TP901 family phage tail tape measure protein
MPLQIPVTQTGLEASIQQAMRNAGRNTQINLGTNSRQINALAQPLGRITGQADEFTKSMEAANARVFAFGASVGIINSVSKAFGALVKNTIQVEKSLVEINSVLNISGDSLQKFGNKLFDVAKNTGQTFDAVAKGALELARQGLSTEESLKRINDALILTRLSGLDAEQSVSGLTAAVNAFKTTGITTSEVLNKLVNVSQKYSVSEKDLIEGLKRSSSVAKQAGVSFDELVGIITAVQERTSVGGAVIGNSFKTIFTRLQRTDTLDALKQLGVSVEDAQGKILPATKLLENLAVKIKDLDQIEIAQITEKVGGGFQIDKLLASLEDLGSKSSVAFEATELSLKSLDEAYKKNAAYNVTLDSLINKVTLSAQQLGATLGAIGVTDSLKGLLSFFNNILEGIQKILGEESALGTFVQGLAKGIGNVLAGPGLALFGAIIAKLSKDLISFGLESLKSFFKIGQSAKEIASVEKAIAAALGSNLTLQRQLFALEGNRAAQIKLMTEAIVQQEAVMRRMASTAGSLAGPLYQQGVRSTGGQGLRVPKAAGGYMPAVAGEASDIRRGVGGARSGDRPVVIPNFAFGGGKKGTMVAHTGEYIVPNFARGGSAIFNRDMIASMGLPSGAQKIGAAGGFIPNFQTARSSVIPEGTSPNKLRGYAAYEGDDPTSLQRKANAQKLLDQKMAKQQVKEQSRLTLDASKFALLVPTIGENNQNGENFSGSFKKGSSSIPYQLKNLKIRGPQVPKAIDQAADPNDEYLKNNIENSIASDSAKYANLLGKPAEKITNVDVLRLFQTNKGAKGAISSAVGAGFEAATMAAIKTSNFKEDRVSKLNQKGGDFDVRGASSDINTLFGLRGIRTMDFKSSRSSGNIDSFAKKLYNELPAALSAKVSRAASGFIPNFAKYIYDSDRITPDKGATLKAVLASQIKKNLIIGPAGSGKSTLAGKMGKFLSGVGDVANASEIDILSGAARAKGGGISKNLEAIISAVNNSGGKVSYLYAKNLDILSRRAGRTVAEEGDLRSKKQLAGTTYAPLNQFDFMGYVKSKSRNFSLINGASGFIPNFADPLKEAIDREMSAGIPASQIYVDQNSSLKNAMNPMGLMVANRRDEPAGGMQGISRARKEGINPMLYGASRGFIPNYVDEKIETTKPRLIEKLNNNFIGLTLGLSFLSGALDSQNRVMQSLSSIMNTVNLSLIGLQGILALTNKTYEKVLRDAQTKNRPFAGAIGMAGGAVAGTALALGTAYSVGSSIYDATLDPNAPDYYKKKSLSFGEMGGYVLGRNAGIDPYALRETEKRQQDLQARIGSRQGNAIISKEEAVSLGLSTEKADRLGVSVALKEYDEALERRNQRIAKEVEASSIKKPGEVITNTTKELFKSIADEIYKASKEVEKIELGAKIASFFGSSLSQIGSKYSQQSSDYSSRRREVVNSSLQQRPSILGDLDAEIEKTKKITGLTKEQYDLLNKNLNILRSSYDVRKLDAALQEIFQAGLVSNLDVLQTTGEQLLTNTKSREDALQLLQKEQEAAKLALDIEVQRGIQLDKNKLLYEQSVYNKSIGFEKQSLVLAGQLLTVNNQIAKVKENYSKTEYQKAREIAALEERSQNIEKASEELDILKERNSVQADYISKVREVINASSALTEDQKINLLSDPNATLEDYKYAIDQIRSEIENKISQGSFKAIPYTIDPAPSQELINQQKSLDNLSSDISFNQKQYNDELDTSNKRTDLLNKKYENLTNSQKEFLRKVEGGFGAGLQDAFTGFRNETDLFEYNIGKAIPELFSKNMGDALSEAISGAKTLEDALVGAANSFLQEINSMILKNLASNLFSGIGNFIGFQSGGSVPKYASGGMINGGSGSKDDVPAMLMGGEFVVNKKSVQKYGPDFLSAINNGTLGGYAKGGVVKEPPVQTGVGGFYIPGTYGQGGIEGRQNLLDFATQTATSGQYDIIRGGDNYASINLEAESMRLTNFGRSRGPMADALRSAKEESFGLYQQDVEAEKQRREQEKELAKQQKAMKKQMLMQIGMAVAGAAISSAGNAGIQGAKAGWTANAGQGFGSQLGGAFKGIFSGAQIGGSGPNVGGLSNWFSGIGNAFKGNFQQAGNYFKLSQIGNAEQVAEAMKNKNFANFMSGSGYTPAMQGENIASVGSNGIFSWAKNIFGKKENIDANEFLATGEDIKDPSQWVRGGDSTAYGEGLLPPLGQKDPNALPYLNENDLSSNVPLNAVPIIKDSGVRANYSRPLNKRYATGGVIPSTSGIDTIPAMLSGGEFIMNRAASQNIGAGNLQALNAGASSLPTEEKTEELNDRLVAKLDELIATMAEGGGSGAITINVDSNGKATQETSGESSESRQKLAAQIKDTVMKVIEQEKRLGGKLRRGLT